MLQIIAALFFLVLFSFALVEASSISKSVFADSIALFVPNMLMIVCALFSSAVMRLRHQGQTAEGFLMPLFLLCVTVESVYLIPEVTALTGFPVISGSLIVKLSRSALLFTAVTLFFASIMSIRNSMLTKAGTYVTFAFIACLVVSFFIPAASNPSPYDIHNSMLALFALIITLAAILTYMFQFTKDREHYNLVRFVTILFLGIGEFVIMLSDSHPIISIIGSILFLIGTVMLVTTAPQGY